MKKFLIQAVLLIAAIVIALYVFRTNPNLTGLPFMPETTVFKDFQVGDARLKVELAETQAKRNKGLGGRESLGQNEGMLFIFPERGKYPFWMKGVSFPLDFIWIRGDKVVDIIQNVPPPAPGQADATLPIYQSKEDVDEVLEVNGGTVQRLNIKAGDAVKIIQ